jgi:hypothetical protein
MNDGYEKMIDALTYVNRICTGTTETERSIGENDISRFECTRQHNVSETGSIVI